MEPSNAKQITGFEHALYDINDAGSQIIMKGSNERL